MKSLYSCIFLSTLLCLTLVSCNREMPAQTEFVLGTICSVNLYEKGSTKIYAEIFSRLHELDFILSANTDTSNLAAINAGAGISPVKAAPETLLVLKEALLYSEKTNGLFDPTVGPLVKTWNIGTDYAAVPSQERINKALPLIDYHKVKINDADNTVYLATKGMKLDLGAVAKGYAADEVIKIISKHGIKRAIVDLGGNIYAYGDKATGTDWTIGIRDPETQQGNAILSIKVKNKSVVTSGIYERFFEENGKKYHHILNTKTGYPEDNELMSVSIITSVSMLGDALSTSTFLLGTDKGLALIEQTADTEAIFIDKNRKIRVSSGLKDQIKIIDDRYSLSEK